jgi:hypothetical protein
MQSRLCVLVVLVFLAFLFTACSGTNPLAPVTGETPPSGGNECAVPPDCGLGACVGETYPDQLLTWPNPCPACGDDWEFFFVRRVGGGYAAVQCDEGAPSPEHVANLSGDPEFLHYAWALSGMDENPCEYFYGGPPSLRLYGEETGPGEWSAHALAFYTVAPPLPETKPCSVFPPDGCESVCVVDGRVRLEIEPYGGEYDIFYHRAFGETGWTEFRASQDANFMEMEAQPGVWYEWKVIVRSGDGWHMMTDTWTFRTAEE